MFNWNSSLPNLSLTGSTDTKIFTVDPNSFDYNFVRSVPTTGAASCGFAQIVNNTYLFSQNIGNYMDVYMFNTTTFGLSRITGIQIPDTYVFVRNIFTTKIGTDIYIWSLPRADGFLPSSYWLFEEGTAYVLKFDTITNMISIVNTFKIAKDIGYKAVCLSVRPYNTYLYNVSSPANKIECYDITNPYNIVKEQSIDANSVNGLFSISQTVNGNTKYYIVINQIGGGQNRAFYDITNVNFPYLLGKNVKAIGVQPGEVCGIYNNYFYGRLSEGALAAQNPNTFIKREKTPFFDQIMVNSQYNQNIGLTSISPTGAVRCSTFNLNDKAYVALLSSTSLSIYDITSVRSSKLVSSISVSIPTNIYDMQTINFNNNQYFLICTLGGIISFILSPLLTSITYTGIFTAIPDAYSESKLFIYNNILCAVVASYTAYVYRFAFTPSLTLTNAPYLTITGKVPVLIGCFLESSDNNQYLVVSTTNYQTPNDIYFYFNVGTSLTLVGTKGLTAPGAMPRSSSQIVSPLDSKVYITGYSNIGWGVYTPNKNNVLESGFTFVNVQSVNVPTNFNGFTRLFYTDKLYAVINQYGGPGTLGDYITCFDFTQPDYGIQIFEKNIASVGTGASTGAPISNLDMQISQLKDRTTLVVLNSNGTFYLYDISNPSFAGKTQTLNIVSEYNNFSSNFGSSYIYKLTNEGYNVYNNSLVSYNSGTGINGALINTSNIKISKNNIDIFVSGSFTDEIQLYNPKSFIPSNQIKTDYLRNNGFIAKFNSITGEWSWILPIYGSDDDIINKLQYVELENKIVVCGFTSSEDLVVYDKQISGTLDNPIFFQANIPGSPNTTNSFIVCINSDGILEWFTNIFSEESSTNVNFLDIGTQGNNIVISGYTNSKIVKTTDSTKNLVQNLYSLVSSNEQYALLTYTFDTNGVYKSSQSILLPPLTPGVPQDIKLFSDLNLFSFCYSTNYQNFTDTFYFNKDGTLAHSDNGPNNTIVSYIVNYLIDSKYIDLNGKEYTTIKLNSIPTYSFDIDFMSNYSMYILGLFGDKVLNKNFSIRRNYKKSDTDYRVVLNNTIDISMIERYLYSVNNIPNSQYNYNINISSSPLYTIFEYNINAMPSVDNTIITNLVSTFSINTTSTYYITIPKNNSFSYILVENIAINQDGFYTFKLNNVNDLRITSPSGAFYGPYLYLTETNKNIFYNLQFFPSTINTPIYFNLSLNSLILPNRPLLQTNSTTPLKLYDMPYIYLALYSINEQNVSDTEIVNIVFDNNPNRERIALFKLNTIESGDFSNFVTYYNSTTPRIKFLPNYYTLRIKLFDRYGNVIQFDNSLTKDTDIKFQSLGYVPPEYMNLCIEFTLKQTDVYYTLI